MGWIMGTYFPRLKEYRHDPNDLIHAGELSIVIEYLGEDTFDGLVATRRAGRTAIIIEGKDELVAPYLTAIEAVREGGE